MRRHEGTLAAAMSLVWLAGCATSALEMAPERPDRPWVPATTTNGEIIAGAHQARGDSRSHLPKSDEAYFHGYFLLKAAILG